MLEADAQSGMSEGDPKDPVFALVEVIEALSGARSIEQIAEIIRTRARLLSGADGVTFVLREGEAVERRRVRFRTLGCYPLTGAVESDAADLEAVIAEMESSALSERAGRLIDHADGDSMEKKKRDGYF